MKAVKYFVRSSSGTLHRVGGCRFSQRVPSDSRQYTTVDDAISHEQRYMKHCKLCFKEKT